MALAHYPNHAGGAPRWKHLLALVGSTGATGIAPIDGGPQQTEDLVAAVKQRMCSHFANAFFKRAKTIQVHDLK